MSYFGFEKLIVEAPHSDVGHYLESHVVGIGPIRAQTLLEQAKAFTTGDMVSPQDTRTALDTCEDWMRTPSVLEDLSNSLVPGEDEQFIRAAGAVLDYWDNGKIALFFPLKR
ncbi:MAG: hypothetical protein WCK31_04840 [bacterium]